jgi:hypothetical protein
VGVSVLDELRSKSEVKLQFGWQMGLLLAFLRALHVVTEAVNTLYQTLVAPSLYSTFARRCEELRDPRQWILY